MGLFSRISRLLRANVNAILDKAEDPEKMLNQLLRDMQVNISEARNQVAAMIAQEKILAADLDRLRKQVAENNARAKTAVAAGRDDLATGALRRSRMAQEELVRVTETYDRQLDVVEALKGQLRQLEDKYRDTYARREILITRARRAEATAKVYKGGIVQAFEEAGDVVDRLDHKVSSREAQAQAFMIMAAESAESQDWTLNDFEDQLALDALKREMLPAQTGPTAYLNEDPFALEPWDEEAIDRELETLKSERDKSRMPLPE